jgi:apoptosis-inducing factor 3
MNEESKPTDPDLALGTKLSDIADGALLAGHVGDEAVVLARVFALWRATRRRIDR